MAPVKTIEERGVADSRPVTLYPMIGYLRSRDASFSRGRFSGRLRADSPRNRTVVALDESSHGGAKGKVGDQVALTYSKPDAQASAPHSKQQDNSWLHPQRKIDGQCPINYGVPLASSMSKYGFLRTVHSESPTVYLGSSPPLKRRRDFLCFVFMPPQGIEPKASRHRP
ncbi:hypothetical protein C8R44DRAFT_742024 [Mycena epipterygia]|nr:hypothetical protein C8R44DRAFT_742024 [Mycena epipterygia]